MDSDGDGCAISIPIATSWTVVSEQWMSAAFAMARGPCPAAVNPSCEVNAIATATCLTRAVFVEERPELGKDCDGNCLADEDNDGICDAVDPRVIPRVYVGDYSQPNVSQLSIPPYNVESAYNDLIEMHRAMALNLDDGSLTKTSNHLTIEDSIHDKGSLEVGRLATFESNVIVNGFVQVDKSIQFGGDLTVDGVTFTNGGMTSTTIENSGDVEFQGTTYVGMNAQIGGATTSRNVVGTSGDFRIHNGLLNNEFDPTFSRVRFSVAPSTGNVRMSGDLDADSDVTMAGTSGFNGVNVDGASRFGALTMDGALDLNSSADIAGNLRVNQNRFVVQGASGNTNTPGNMSVGKDMTIRGHVHIAKNLTIEGTTFANGGIVTTSVNMEGDLDVGGNINVGKDLAVGGVTTVLNDVNIASDFSVYKGATDGSERATFTVNPATGDSRQWVHHGNLVVCCRSSDHRQQLYDGRKLSWQSCGSRWVVRARSCPIEWQPNHLPGCDEGARCIDCSTGPHGQRKRHPWWVDQYQRPLAGRHRGYLRSAGSGSAAIGRHFVGNAW